MCSHVNTNMQRAQLRTQHRAIISFELIGVSPDWDELKAIVVPVGTDNAYTHPGTIVRHTQLRRYAHAAYHCMPKNRNKAQWNSQRNRLKHATTSVGIIL